MNNIIINSKKIKEALEGKDIDFLQELITTCHPVDIAESLRYLSTDDVNIFLSHLTLDKQAEVISYFTADKFKEVSLFLGSDRLALIFNSMSHDDRVHLLKLLPSDFCDEVVRLMAKSEREDVVKLLSYGEESVGAIMTTDYAVLYPQLTVEEALEKLRQEVFSTETINRVFVINESRHIVGTLKLAQIISAKRGLQIRDIMDETIVAIKVDDTPEHAAKMIAKYDMVALPVIDEQFRLCGIVTYDDAMDILQQEATEDFHHLGMVSHMPGNLTDSSSWSLYRRRVGWLVLLVFGNIFSGAGIAYFEDTIATYVALVFFLPLLIDSGGNAGSQSATIMVRALATGEVVLRDWGKMIGKEIFVALGLGLTMALAVSILGVVRGGYEIAFVVSTTMILVVIVGSLIGMSLPFILSRFNLDPASASAPLITSIADALGVLIYFAIATAVLGVGAA